MVELPDHAPYKCAVGDPVLDENAQWFLDESAGFLRRELLRAGRHCSHSQRTPVGRKGPCVALSRCDQQIAHPRALMVAVANPRCAGDFLRLCVIGRVPHVPPVIDLMQDAVEPAVGIWFICDSRIDGDTHEASTGLRGRRAGWR